MQNMPLIDRSDIDFTDQKVHNIGYAEGILIDGRPYRLECWAQDQITCITIFISAIGIENLASDEVMNYLEAEGLYKRIVNTNKGSARKFMDDKANIFWSANLVIGSDEGMYADSLIPLKPFKKQK